MLGQAPDPGQVIGTMNEMLWQAAANRICIIVSGKGATEIIYNAELGASKRQEYQPDLPTSLHHLRSADKC